MKTLHTHTDTHTHIYMCTCVHELNSGAECVTCVFVCVHVVGATTTIRMLIYICMCVCRLHFLNFSSYSWSFLLSVFPLYSLSLSRILPYSRRHVRQPRWTAACNHWRITIPLRSKWSHNCRSTRPIRQPLFSRSHRMFRLRSPAHWVHRRLAPAYRSLRRSCRYYSYVNMNIYRQFWARLWLLQLARLALQ